MFFHLPFHPELYSTNVTYTTSCMCLVMCKRRLKHCYVKCVENNLRRKKEILKHVQKKHNGILIPSQRYQESRHLLQNPTFPNYVMGFSNRAQRFTWYNYLDVDSPFEFVDMTKIWEKSEVSHPKNPSYGRHWLSQCVRLVKPKQTLFDTFFVHLYAHFPTLWVYFAFRANGQVACHGQDYLELCAITKSWLVKVQIQGALFYM